MAFNGSLYFVSDILVDSFDIETSVLLVDSKHYFLLPDAILCRSLELLVYLSLSGLELLD